MFCSKKECGLVKEFPATFKNYINSIRACDNFCDKTVALVVAKDSKYLGNTKHIKKRYHYIKDAIIENDVVLKHIFTSNLVANPLTKPIAKDIYVGYVRFLGLCRM